MFGICIVIFWSGWLFQLSWKSQIIHIIFCVQSNSIIENQKVVFVQERVKWNSPSVPISTRCCEENCSSPVLLSVCHNYLNDLYWIYWAYYEFSIQRNIYTVIYFWNFHSKTVRKVSCNLYDSTNYLLFVLQWSAMFKQIWNQQTVKNC